MTKDKKTEKNKAKDVAAKRGKQRGRGDLAGMLHDEPLFVVGLGASAGGLESFEKFFTNIPPDSGMAFVVVVHLDPQHKTLLPELIGRYTRMNVLSAEEGMRVEANQVYIIPSNRDLTLTDGLLHLDEQLKPRGVRYTIDNFFRSLAEDREENSAAVILSGTGTDGTQGIKAVKLAGGLVIVEDEQSAKYSGMPQSAIASGVADLVLPAERIGEKLIELYGHRFNGDKDELRSEKDIAGNLRQIYQIVNKSTGHDFSAYKTNTMVRRTDRRMAVNNISRVGDYVDFIKDRPDECRALLREMLIGVTSFFRDRDGFKTLEQDVIPKFFANRNPENSVRVWVAGCATGEEAYSIAILLREKLLKNGQDCKVQIFATDLDQDAVEFARAGVYPEGISADLSESRLKRFFHRSGDNYEVSKSLREMIVFAQHNLIKDPPFSRLDLLVCRNLLIYLNPDVQKRLLPLFYQTIKPGGFLFLGSSETVGAYTDLFQPVNKKWKIFSRREAGRRIGFELPLTLPEKQGPIEGVQEEQTPVNHPKPGQVAEQLLVQRYSPPCVVINEKHDVLYYSTRTARYLEPPIGEPTQDILRMAREELRPALRAAIHKALSSQESVVYKDLRVPIGEQEERIRLIVEPLKRPASLKGMALVIFESDEQRPMLVERPIAAPRPADEDEKGQIISQLEEQLRITHEELQTAIERLESSNEELKSSNEELMSMNEEFQSTNEELETSKEELQALNEELVTVNAELEKKVEELGQTNDDMQNLLTSSEVATIFLDRELRVKLYTPKIADLFNLIDSDIGRPIHHFKGQVSYPNLSEDATQVLENLAPVERELSASNDKHYLMRMLPYRTMSDKIAGVVVTLTDITARHQAEESRAQLAAIVEASTDAVFSTSLDGIITSWNTGAVTQLGYSVQEIVGSAVAQLVDSDARKKLLNSLKRLKLGQNVKGLQLEMIRKNNRMLDVEISMAPICDAAGAPVSASVISRDISPLKEKQRKLEERERLYQERAAELEALMESVPAIVWIANDPECRQITGNRTSYEVLRQSRQANLSKSAPEGERPRNFRVFKDGQRLSPEELPMQVAARTGEPVTDFEEEIIFDDGTSLSLIGNAVPLFDEKQQVRGAVAAFIDISKLKKYEAALHEAMLLAENANQAKSEFLANVSHEVRTPLTGLTSMLDLLKETKLDAEQQRLHELAKRSTETLLDVINDILDFARIEAGKLAVEEKAFELRPWAEEIVTHYGVKYHDQPFSLKLVLDQDLPAEVVTDPKRLGQVLSNLVDNACKFTEEGEIEISLATTAENGTSFLDLTVRDTGCGIPQDQLGKIFQSFSQLDSGFSREKKGTGLGLSITRKIVDLLGGRINVSSTEGEGSTFCCLIPLGQERDSEQKPHDKKERMHSIQLKDLSVLLVEDDQVIAEGLRKQMQKAGWQVSIAERGAAALMILEKQQFDLILMDVQMPGMSGLDTTRKIQQMRKNRKKIPIVGLTAHGRPEDQAMCRESGMLNVLVKPVSMEQIIQAAEEALEAVKSR